MGGVLDLDVHVQELVADGVGLGEVLIFAGGLTSVEERLDLGGVDACAGGAVVAQLGQEGGRLVAEDAEDFRPIGHQHLEFIEEGLSAFGFAQVLVFADASGQAHGGEDVAQGSGGVQVIFHGLGEADGDGVEFRIQLLGERGFFPFGLGQFHVHLGHGGIDALDAFFGFFEGVEGEVQGGAVVHGQQEVAQCFGQELVQDVADGEEVAQGFGHLFGVDLHEPVVHPEVCERLARGRLGLGNLVFVVREGEVLAAAVNVQRQGRELLAHSRAFQVPAGAALAPGRIPRRFAGLGGLPQGEVEGVLFFLARVDARAGLQFVDVAARKLAVAVKGTDLEVDVPGRGGVGMALFDEVLGERDHLRDVLGAPGLDSSPVHGQAVHVHVELADELLGDVGGVLAHLARALDDLVVHVREVADEGDVIPLVFEVAEKDVEDHAGAGVTDVAEVVGGDAADVHVDLVVVERGELLLFAGQGIVESH